MTDDQLKEMRAKVERADQIKRRLARLRGAAKDLLRSTGIWVRLQDGEVCQAIDPNPSINLHIVLDGEDAGGMAMRVREFIAKDIYEQIKRAEAELASL